MDKIQKFQIGSKYYPKKSNKNSWYKIIDREGKMLTIKKHYRGVDNTFLIHPMYSADKRGAFEYFIDDLGPITSTDLIFVNSKLQK